MSTYRKATYGIGTALAAVLALMMVPSGASVTEAGPTMYGMAEVTISNVNGDVLSSNTIHNDITDEGEAAILNTIFLGRTMDPPVVICMGGNEIQDEDLETATKTFNHTSPDFSPLFNLTTTNAEIIQANVSVPLGTNITVSAVYDVTINGITSMFQNITFGGNSFNDPHAFPQTWNAGDVYFHNVTDTEELPVGDVDGPTQIPRNVLGLFSDTSPLQKTPCVIAAPISDDILNDGIVSITATEDISTAIISATFNTTDNFNANQPLHTMMICTLDPFHPANSTFENCERAAGPDGFLLSMIKLGGSSIGDGDIVNATYTLDVTSPTS